MSNLNGTSKNDSGYDGNEYSIPVNFGQNDQQLQHHQLQQALESLQGGQLNGQYPQQLPQNMAYNQAMSNSNFGQLPTNNSNLDESNPWLVYDRTIKVAKADYSDHGNHGVASLPLPGGQPLSSVQMQLQMQQIMQQQQQRQQQQTWQDGLNVMMPSPNVNMPQQIQSIPYPSLVPGTLGSQQFFQPLNDTQPTNNIAGTSATQLIQALNAELASRAGQPAPAAPHTMESQSGGGNQLESLLAAVGAGAPQLNNAPLITNLSTLMNAGLNNSYGQTFGSMPAANYQSNIEAPGDIRYGKKRVSPSLPLHPSQLQPNHGGLLVGGASGYSLPSSNLGMKSVAEEEEEAGTVNNSVTGQSQQNAALYNTTMNALNNYIEQIGGVATAAAAIGQMPPQSQLPAAQQLGALGLQGQLGGNVPGFDPLAAAQVAQAAQVLQKVEQLGDPLTNPSEPAANSGLDNSEGNLIVRRGDVFRIPRKSMHPHPPPKPDRKPSTPDEDPNEILEYTALALLGQGTFAQVFHCVEKKTGHSVAIKIVKNKPAYTRQAAVEIDVFRKLNSEDTDGDESDSNDATPQSPSEQSSNSTGHKATADKSIIRLKYYFMHCSHLCLVFEMLGPNLYELLKKRQFRGLPIGAVKALVRQAVEGIKLLGKKKVVQ
jgi:hypothetical protein